MSDLLPLLLQPSTESLACSLVAAYFVVGPLAQVTARQRRLVCLTACQTNPHISVM